MIREAIEMLGPVGCLPSSEATLLRGPTLTDEAEVLVEGIRRMAGQQGR